jgi:hypothetical protein
MVAPFVPAKHTHIVERAKANPLSIYRAPNDVLRDRRLTASERIEILTVWQATAAEDIASNVAAALQEAERRLETQEDAVHRA